MWRVISAAAVASASCTGAAAESACAWVRYQSSSCSGRMIAKAANIPAARAGARRQSRPPNVPWMTCCPAPKQS